MVAPGSLAGQGSDTVRVEPGEHAAVEIEFREGPTSDVRYEVEVTEGPNIDVLVMDNANYQAYKAGDEFEYVEGWSDLDTGNTQAEVLLEEHGTWWLVLDHTSVPDGGASPAMVGSEPATASYTLEVEPNVEEEIRDRWTEIPSVGTVGVLASLGLGLVVARW